MRIKSIKFRKWSLIGTLVICSGYAIYSLTNNLLEKFIDRSRPELQKRFSNQLKRPIVIGPFNGLRFWGFAIGPSSLQESPFDNSKVNFSGLKIQFAPLESLLSWKPVIIFSPSHAEFYFDGNEVSPYFPSKIYSESKAPNLGLKIRLDNSSSIFLQASKTEIKTKAKGLFDLAEKKVQGKFSFVFPDDGVLVLKGKGYWDRLNLNAKARFNKFDLQNLQIPVFNKLNLVVNGRVNSDISLRLDKTNVKCRGDLSLDNFNLRSTTSTSRTIFSKNTSIKCKDNSLVIPNTKFEYGSWAADISAFMPIDSRSDYNLKILSLIRAKEQINSPLRLNASLPLSFKKQRLSLGELTSEVDLDSFSLSSLSSLVGTPLSGTLSATGTVSGPLSSLKSNLSIEIDNPQISAIRLQEKWQGNFSGLAGVGGKLNMSSIGAAVSGKLEAELKRDWSLDKLVFKRLGGLFSLEPIPEGYRWIANDFRLDRLEVAIPPDKSFRRTFGKLFGEGVIKTNPFFIDGELVYSFPRLLGVSLREAILKASYTAKKYSLIAEIIPPDIGKIVVNADGTVGGSFQAKAFAKGISPNWLVDSSLKISQFNLLPKFATGSAEDLSGLSLVSTKESLDTQLRNWDVSRVFVERYKRNKSKKTLLDPSDLKGILDAEATLKGSTLSDLNLEVKASGNVWMKGDKKEEIVKLKPFQASFNSFSLRDTGEFSVLNLPFSVLSLFFSTPSSLSGMFGFTGRYNFKKKSPELNAELVLTNARLADRELILQKGDVFLANSIIKTDIAFKALPSNEIVSVAGQIPLSPSTTFDLKVESHGDGLSFFDGLSENLIDWESGNTDLKLLIRGTLSNPIANGYLVVRDGTFLLNKERVDNFEGRFIFDFNRFEVQELKAQIGKDGSVLANGSMSLFRAEEKKLNGLNVEINSIDIKRNASAFKLSSMLNIKGSVIKPLLGGEVTVTQGAISTKRSRSKNKSTNVDERTSSSTTQIRPRSFPEQNWDYQSPIRLLIQDQNSPASRILDSKFPRHLSFLTFDKLKLSLGPNVRVVSQPFASFTAAGSLILDGPLDQSLALRGVVRLKKGRVNLFTTTFLLDREEPNIALFAPSMGFIPYLDVTMTSRVSDVIQNPSQLDSSSDFALNGSGSVGIGGSRIINVELNAIGPADRVFASQDNELSDSIDLRSIPALPREQIIDLIGGNSFSMLLSGSEQEVLLDLLNRSFLSPVLGTISGAFDERVQFYVYPAFVSSPDIPRADVSDSDENTLSSSDPSNNELPSQQAWIAEVGLDLSKRINFSIQTTPNRKDISPQGTIKYQFNSNIGILGSLDKNGNWQSQLQLFVRY